MGVGTPVASYSAHSQDIFEYIGQNPGPLVLLQRGSGRWASPPLGWAVTAASPVAGGAAPDQAGTDTDSGRMRRPLVLEGFGGKNLENSCAEEKAWKEVAFKSFLWVVLFFMIKLSPHVLHLLRYHLKEAWKIFFVTLRLVEFVKLIVPSGWWNRDQVGMFAEQ